MKKILSAVLVCVMLLSYVFVLASCGNKLSGTYEDKLGLTSVTFKGNTIEMKAGDEEVMEGTYKIDGDSITIEVEIDGEKETDTLDFEKGKDDDGKYIKIENMKYYKK